MLLSFQRPSRPVGKGTPSSRDATRDEPGNGPVSDSTVLGAPQREPLGQCRPTGTEHPSRVRGGIRAPQARTWTETTRSRGRSSKSSRTTCCQVPRPSAPSTIGIDSDGPDERRAQVRVGVRVVVELVVRGSRASGRDQALQQRLQVAARRRARTRSSSPRPSRRRRTPTATPVCTPERSTTVRTPSVRSTTSPSPVGRQPQQAGVDGSRGQTRRRRNWRLPTWSTRAVERGRAARRAPRPTAARRRA